MANRLIFTSAELLAFTELPDALRALVHYHDVMITLAEAHGFNMAVQYHKERQDVIRAEADRLDARYANGEDPGFTEQL